MTVACPAPEWPTELLEEGPTQDRSILLRGEAAIGGAAFRVTAIRVNPIRFGPDYRMDCDAAIYANYDLPALLDRLSELVDVAELPTLQLRTGNYLMWMLPLGAEV